MSVVKVISHGEDVAVVIPRELAQQFGLRAGEDASVDAREDRLELRAANVDQATYERQMESARRIMTKYRDALAELAK